MAWQRIAAELTAQFEATERQEWEAELADRAEAEAARIRLTDRLAVAADPIGIQAAGEWVRGSVADVGADFVVLEEGPRTVLIPLAAIDEVVDLPPGAREPGSEGEVAARYRLSAALRALVRGGAELRVVTRSGPVIGVITGVGADHLALARAGAAGEVVVPFDGIRRVELRG